MCLFFLLHTFSTTLPFSLQHAIFLLSQIGLYTLYFLSVAQSFEMPEDVYQLCLMLKHSTLLFNSGVWIACSRLMKKMGSYNTVIIN